MPTGAAALNWLPRGTGKGVVLGWAVVLAAAVVVPEPAAGQGARRLVVDGLAVYAQATGAERVSIQAYVRAGRSTAGAGRGRTADLLAAWMQLGGSQSLPGRDFAAARAALGAVITVSADQDLLVAEMTVPSENLHPAKRLFADMLMYPSFDPGEEAAARRMALRAWPSRSLGLLRVHRTLAGEGDDIAADEPGDVAAIAPSEVVAFHRQRVGIDATVLALEGPIGEVDVEAEMRSAFLGFRLAGARAEPGGKKPPALGGAIVTVHGLEVESRLLVARSALPRTHPDWLPVLAALLATEEEASFTRIDQPLVGPDVVVLGIDTRAGGESMAAAAAVDVLARLRAGKVSATGLDRARRFLGRALVPDPAAPGAARAYARLEALGLPGEDPAASSRRLAGLTPATVGRALRR